MSLTYRFTHTIYEIKKEREQGNEKKEKTHINICYDKDIYNDTIHNDDTYYLPPLLVERIVHE
jgi:hypothetical protein